MIFEVNDIQRSRIGRLNIMNTYKLSLSLPIVWTQYYRKPKKFLKEIQQFLIVESADSKIYIIDQKPRRANTHKKGRPYSTREKDSS